jgi:hypothetical protein
MIHDRAAQWRIAALVISVLVGAGCGTDTRGEDPDPGSLTDSTQSCRSSIDASGLLCSICGDDERGRRPECLPAE